MFYLFEKFSHLGCFFVLRLSYSLFRLLPAFLFFSFSFSFIAVLALSGQAGEDRQMLIVVVLLLLCTVYDRNGEALGDLL